jgi:hypothetical protein
MLVESGHVRMSLTVVWECHCRQVLLGEVPALMAQAPHEREQRLPAWTCDGA